MKDFAWVYWNLERGGVSSSGVAGIRLVLNLEVTDVTYYE
jgi:hypothetical protein